MYARQQTVLPHLNVCCVWQSSELYTEESVLQCVKYGMLQATSLRHIQEFQTHSPPDVTHLNGFPNAGRSNCF